MKLKHYTKPCCSKIHLNSSFSFLAASPSGFSETKGVVNTDGSITEAPASTAHAKQNLFIWDYTDDE